VFTQENLLARAVRSTQGAFTSARRQLERWHEVTFLAYASFCGGCEGVKVCWCCGLGVVLCIVGLGLQKRTRMNLFGSSRTGVLGRFAEPWPLPCWDRGSLILKIRGCNVEFRRRGYCPRVIKRKKERSIFKVRRFFFSALHVESIHATCIDLWEWPWVIRWSCVLIEVALFHRHAMCRCHSDRLLCDARS